MKRSKWVIGAILVIAVFAYGFCGNSLVKEASSTNQMDRWIGIFITTEYLDLFDMDGYLNDHIVDMHLSTAYIDEDEKNSLEGTIYYSPTIDDVTLFLNPVYQTADGQVYVTSGNGCSLGGIQGEGAVMSYFYDSSIEIKEGDTKRKDTVAVTINLESRYPSSQMKLIGMNENHEVIEEVEFKEGEIPEKFEVAKNTDYLVVEETKLCEDGTQKIVRSVYSDGDESVEYFAATDNGILSKEQIELLW